MSLKTAWETLKSEIESAGHSVSGEFHKIASEIAEKFDHENKVAGPTAEPAPEPVTETPPAA